MNHKGSGKRNGVLTERPAEPPKLIARPARDRVHLITDPCPFCSADIGAACWVDTGTSSRIALIRWPNRSAALVTTWSRSTSYRRFAAKIHNRMEGIQMQSTENKLKIILEGNRLELVIDLSQFGIEQVEGIGVYETGEPTVEIMQDAPRKRFHLDVF